VIHIDLDLPALRKRLINLPTRGVVRVPGQTLGQLFAERQPLYRKYAHLTIDCTGCSHEEMVRKIVRGLKRFLLPDPPKKARAGKTRGTA
jgi:shikimate kinase